MKVTPSDVLNKNTVKPKVLIELAQDIDKFAWEALSDDQIDEVRIAALYCPEVGVMISQSIANKCSKVLLDRRNGTLDTGRPSYFGGN